MVVAPGPSKILSTSTEPSTKARAIVPKATISLIFIACTSSEPVPLPKGPLHILRVSQKLMGLNDWMQIAISTLFEISNVVVGQTSTHPDPYDIDMKLTIVLDNQKAIMETLIQHGVVMERLTKQVKKMRKTQANKNSVDSLCAEVKRIVEADNMSFDMLMDPTLPHPAQPSHNDPTAQAEETFLASSTIVAVHDMFIYQVALIEDDDKIQLAEPTGLILLVIP